jgi:thiol-disulfide isomerase/thioredoxin
MMNNSIRSLVQRIGFTASSVLATIACTQPACTSDGYPLDNTFHTQGRAPSAAPQPTSFAYRYPDTPPVLDEKGLQEFVGRYRHRVVLLDFWASWSRQTREELGALTRLQNEMEAEGFQVIACNFDDPKVWSSSTVPMLNSSRASYPCVVIPESARRKIREWLAPNWSYDLPARFVINRQGQVAEQALGGAPFSQIEQRVRQLVMHGGSSRSESSLSLTAAALRSKLIDVRQAKGQSLPEVVSDPPDATRLANQQAAFISSRLDRTKNPRIAIVPFASSKDRAGSTELGLATAKQLEQILRDKGFFDLIGPGRTDRMLRDADLTAMAVDYDPTLAKGRLDCDYLLIGWLRGDVRSSPSRPEIARTATRRQEPLREVEPPPEEEP